MKRLIVILILILVLLFIFYRINVFFKEKNSQTAQMAERIIPVEVEIVKTSPYTPVLNYTGEVKSIEEIEIFPKASGKLVQMKVKEGDRVKEGQLVALIDRDITGLKFELAETFSPVEGIVGKVYVDKGAEVNPDPGMGTPLAQILNLDSVKIVIQVTEKDLPKVKLYQRAKITVDAYPDKVFQGVINLISPIVNNLTRTINVEIIIPNLDHLLRPGMFTEVSIITGKTEELVLIPRHAILIGGGKKKIYVVKNGMAEERWIETGFSEKGLTSVKKGLASLDSLVTLGQSQLQPGDKVRIVKGE
jgi:multidrug efflux pump subunit AcrA (membrane-fusion protein)